VQEITDNAMTVKKRPQVAGDNRQNGCQTECDKPGTLIFTECCFHTFTASLFCLHQGQKLTQISWTLPQPGQLSRNTLLQFGQTSQPVTTFSEQSGHSPVKGMSGDDGLSNSMQMK
jgi:hypothetical protein